MKVLFLGAGASVSAGYPVATQLLPAAIKRAERTPFVVEREYLARWQATKRQALDLGLDPLLLEATNPEIPLTALDPFLQAAQEARLEHLYAVTRGESNNRDALEKWRQPQVDIARARDAIRGLLAHDFQCRMYEDAEKPSKRAYLRPLLASLQPGDIVITLNWDTTVEMTLAEDGRWSPVDGYHLRSSRVVVRRDRHTAAEACPPSEIAVLKLHGGVGWMSDEFDVNHIYLSQAYFLQFLRYAREGQRFNFDETGHRKVEELTPFLIIPSYLKRVPVGRTMLEIWDRAMQAIAHADEVEIWGYGLPESDGEVRLALSVLRRRLDTDQVKVAVCDPSGDARARWTQLLGPKADVRNERLG